MVDAHSFISKATVLIIDDDPSKHNLTSDLLKDYCKAVRVAKNTKNALKIVQSDSPPDIIFLKIMMPGVAGYEDCKNLNRVSKTRSIPVIFLTEKNEMADEAYDFERGILDCIAKPISFVNLLGHVKTHLEMKNRDNFFGAWNALLEDQVQKRTAELMAALDVAIQAMAYLGETRDNVTGNHVCRVQYYVKALAEKLRFHPRFVSFLDNDYTIELLIKTAPLHDIGNVGIPDRILLKPGRLTPDEFDIIKTHTSIGRNVILQAERDLKTEMPFLKYAKEIVYSHHEKWDGSGYPEGLAGDAIPISARLIAIADVYDALISRRVYRPSVSHEQAVKIILEGKGTQFDSDIVDSFYEVHEEFHRISQTYADSEQDFKKKIDYLEKAIAVDPYS